MTEPAPYTHAELAACAERELRQRKRVYPRLVTRGRMTADDARAERAKMTAIRDHFRALADASPAENGRLL